MTTAAPKSLRIFCSYSHKDDTYLNELRIWLLRIERQEFIEWWHDGEISPSWEWEEPIGKNLRTAKFTLLLVRPAFMPWDYVYDKEIGKSIEGYEWGEARVIPKAVRPTHWKWTSISKLQAIPKESKSISAWPNWDEAWLDAIEGIRIAVRLFNRLERLRGESSVREQEASLARQTQLPVESLPQAGGGR